MPNAFISGTAMYVPPQVVTNDDLRNKYGIDTSDEWIQKRTGIKERRFAEEGVNSSDLAVPASKEAVERAGLTLQDIDMIIFATLSSDFGFPGCGVFLQEKLGLCEVGHFVPALDIRNQCTGFLHGLATGASMVQAGGCKNVLLVGAETHSAAMDFTTRGRDVCSLFGDGAGAVVISATEEDRGVRSWNLGADGRGAELLCQKVWDMSKRPYIPTDEEGVGQVPPSFLWTQMQGRKVFRHAVERMLGALMKSFSTEKITLEDVDLVLFHQANLRIIQYIQQQIGLPEDKILNNMDRYGNTTAGSLPILLAEAERTGRLKQGDKVVMVAFGSGFTWGSAVVDW